MKTTMPVLNDQQPLNGSGETPQPLNKRRGFLLWRVEVLNWGTLGEDVVHSVDLYGNWLCITGRNGTGKSTLADAIITAFPPANIRIHYNAAGGAHNTKERTRLTYLRGYYGHEQDDSGRAKPSALRNKPGSLTAILLQFHEEATERWVTALVLGTFTATNEERWLYGIVDRRENLSVIQGTEDWESRAKRLRNKEKWQLTSEAGKYRESLLGLLRIPSEKAITTFVRTVGLKDIGNVNAFIRGNMLDDVSVHARYVELIKHYQKQLEIDTEIEDVRKMIEKLVPIEQQAPVYREAVEALRDRESVLNAVDWRINDEKSTLLEKLIGAEKTMREIVQEQIRTDRLARTGTQTRLDNLRASEAAQRIQNLIAQEKELQEKRRLVEAKRDELSAALSLIGEETPSVPTDHSSYLKLREYLRKIVYDADNTDEQRSTEIVRQDDLVKEIDIRITETQRAIDAAKENASHLPPDDLERRAQIAKATGLNPQELPYIGELLDVPLEYMVWRPAIEKLLRTYARRMLVPEAHFPHVIAYVNSTDFRQRVRIQKVPSKTIRFTVAANNDKRCVCCRLRIKPESPFADWLHNELHSNYKHICCESIEEYSRCSSFAITREGLVKGAKSDYHEKRDDLHIRGPRDYYLGWNNEGRLRELIAERNDWFAQLANARSMLKKFRENNTSAKEQRDTAKSILDGVSDFSVIDQTSITKGLAMLRSDQKDFAQKDPEAAAVQKEISDLINKMVELDEKITQDERKDSSHETTIKRLKDELREIDEVQADYQNPEDDIAGRAADFFDEPLPDDARKLGWWKKNVRNKANEYFAELIGRRSAAETKINGFMHSFLALFPAESKALSANIEALDSFMERLHYLREEKMAELQERFRNYLNDNLALHSTQLKASLESQVSEAEKRIAQINKILERIMWDEGEYIKILLRPNPDSTIKRFRDILSKATAPLIAPTPEQQDSAFQAIKTLIDYLSHENTRKMVLDARNWKLFAVQTIDMESGVQKFYREDTDGLSGGQKNKLSVTLLASALAFQYDLVGPGANPGTFRTVLIDEAFARLDSENARYALELFRQFGFQLVLIHPLDGTVRVAEDYVQTFLLASIRNNRNSVLTPLRIEQFRQLIDEKMEEEHLTGEVVDTTSVGANEQEGV